MNLGTIRARARRKLDELTATYWTDADLNDAINEGYFYYWQWMVKKGHPGALLQVDLNIVANVADIAFPADFIKPRLVERVLTSGRTVPMKPKERYETPNATAAATGDAYLPKYRIMGRNLRVEPTPAASIANGVGLTYYFRPVELTADANEPNAGFDAIWHWLLVYYAVIGAKTKEEAIGHNGVDFGPTVKAQKELEDAFKETLEPISDQRYYAEPFSTDDEQIII